LGLSNTSRNLRSCLLELETKSSAS
jgi:hypothetical protein